VRFLGLVAGACLVACSFDGGQAQNNRGDAAPDAALDALGTIDAALDGAAGGFVYAGPRDTLYRVSVTTLAPTEVGDFLLGNVATPIADMALDMRGRLIGRGRSTNRNLSEIIPETAERTLLPAGVTPNGTFRGLSFGYPNGVETLFATTDSGNLYTLDPVDGVITLIGFFGNGYGTRGDITWLDGVGLLAAANDFDMLPAPLALVNTDVGTAEILGITDDHHLGLASHDGALFGFAEDSNDIFVLDPADGSTLQRAASNIGWEHAAP